MRGPTAKATRRSSASGQLAYVAGPALCREQAQRGARQAHAARARCARRRAAPAPPRARAGRRARSRSGGRSSVKRDSSSASAGSKLAAPRQLGELVAARGVDRRRRFARGAEQRVAPARLLDRRERADLVEHDRAARVERRQQAAVAAAKRPQLDARLAAQLAQHRQRRGCARCPPRRARAPAARAAPAPSRARVAARIAALRPTIDRTASCAPRPVTLAPFVFAIAGLPPGSIRIQRGWPPQRTTPIAPMPARPAPSTRARALGPSVNPGSQNRPGPRDFG